MANEGAADGVVVKLDAGGGHIFDRSFGGAGHHHGCGVAVDREGSILVAGSFEDELDVDGAVVSQGAIDVFVAKLDESGAVLWSRRFGDEVDQTCSSLAADAKGNVLLAGRFEGALDSRWRRAGERGRWDQR